MLQCCACCDLIWKHLKCEPLSTKEQQNIRRRNPHRKRTTVAESIATLRLRRIIPSPRLILSISLQYSHTLNPSFFLQVGKVLGGDLSGVVSHAPDGARYPIGTKVFGVTESYFKHQWGTYAEFAAVPQEHLAAVPEGLSMEEAASLPLVGLTALQALDVGNLIAGQHILVHAGSGGVGLSAIQIAKSRGLKVTTTTSAANVQFLKDLGADNVIDYKSVRFEEACERPVHLVIDCVGGDYEPRSMSLLERDGWFVSLLAKPSPAQIIFGKLRGMLRLGPHYHLMSVRPSGAQVDQLAKMWQEGKLKPILHRVFPIGEVVEAHVEQETGKCRGKIVLRVENGWPE
jgi:NADPH:quinone reductase-like Zn-dependent oxidoreductase